VQQHEDDAAEKDEAVDHQDDDDDKEKIQQDEDVNDIIQPDDDDGKLIQPDKADEKAIQPDDDEAELPGPHIEEDEAVQEKPPGSILNDKDMREATDALRHLQTHQGFAQTSVGEDSPSHSMPTEEADVRDRIYTEQGCEECEMLRRNSDILLGVEMLMDAGAERAWSDRSG
jgi:hypothetical protein